MTRPTLTRFGTVAIPFQDPRGRGFVVEMSREQWRTLVGEVRLQFARLDRFVEQEKAILGIERHESVVG